jgi:hypothetical protein
MEIHMCTTYSESVEHFKYCNDENNLYKSYVRNKQMAKISDI